MACGSGCCVPAVKQPTALGLYPSSSSSAHAERGHLGKHVPEHMATLGVHGDTHACTDGCCEVTDASAGGKVTAAATLEDNSGDSCCAAEVTSRTDSNEAADGCQDKCCTAEAVSQGQGTTDYGCCGDDICCQKDQDFNAQNQKAQEQVVCNDKSCDEKGPVFSSKPEECCLGKPSPCCDDSCLDRLAARECRNFSTRCSDTSLSSNACQDHSQSIRSKYAAKLETLGCLCRALIALGQESCCPPVKRTSLERRRCTSRPSSPPHKSVDVCCVSSSAAAGSQSTTPARSRSNTGGHESVAKGNCVDACCSSAGTGGLTNEKSNTITATNSLVPDCKNRDLEAGLAGTEHVVLSISGMTCTGCETKLNRTLAALTSVTSLKTSLVLSRAQFDIDLSRSSVSDVVKHLERTTEFKCERINSHGSNIDVVTPCDAAEFIKRDWPIGVTAVTLVDKKIVNITFDATILGARDLVEKGWGEPLRLAPLQADPNIDAGSKHVRHIGYWTILSAVLTIPVLVMAWAPLPNRNNHLIYGIPSLILATLVQVLIAGPFYPKALKALIFTRVIEMDLLIVLSTTAAYAFSIVSFSYEVSGMPLSTGQFFETSTLLVTLIMVGRYVAALARQKAIESISVRSLQVSTALLSEAGGEKEIDVRLLQHGDVFKVLPDSRIPTDGTVISGSSEINESMVTGESRPVEKYKNSAVIAGSVNGAGILLVRLNRSPGDNTINTIANMVDEAKLSKPKLQVLADRVAFYFVPVVVTLTILTFCTWVAVGMTRQDKSGSEAAIQAVTFAITVLIVSCPCAVGLAVPMVIVITSGIAAERGVIIKSASTIETAHKTSHVVLDKTGTLTEGRLKVVSQVYFNETCSSDEAKSWLLALLANNKHPVSAGVVSALRDNDISPSAELVNIRVLTGKGVEASTATGLKLRAGNSRWLGLTSNPHVQSILSAGNTAFCFTINATLIAAFGLRDSLRPDVLATTTKLRERGIKVHVLSGDDDGAVRTITTALNIPDSNVRSRCTPADKQDYIRNLHPATVLFCGDGTNDAVGLAQSSIGVHMDDASGTDVAQSAADVVLMRPSLGGILTLIDVSRKAVRRIAFNFAWSFVYNLFAVLLGAGAFAALRDGGVRIPPAFAGLGELVSVVPVVAAAAILRWERI